MSKHIKLRRIIADVVKRMKKESIGKLFNDMSCVENENQRSAEINSEERLCKSKVHFYTAF